jgi:hypothetical protein
MKTLTDYIIPARNELMNKTGAFFAFSNSALDKNKVKGVEYVSLGNGIVVPKANAGTLVIGLNKVTSDGIEQDFAENGRDAIIQRELNNHEASITCSIEDTAEALSGYDIEDWEIEIGMRTMFQQRIDNNECF